KRNVSRPDVLRLCEEEFHSCADASPTSAPPPPPPGRAASLPQAVRPPGDRLRLTVHGLDAYVPPSPRSATGGSLASFLVRSGGLTGQRLSVKTPVVNIGRAD